MTRSAHLNRRTLIAGMGAGTGAMAIPGLAPNVARAADPGKTPLLVFALFAGGWDTLITLDPRDHRDFNDPAREDTSIVTGYNMMANMDDEVAGELDKSGGSGLVKPDGSNITFGPAIGEIQKHFSKLTIVRGINMGTLDHGVGIRYFNTGKVPRGINASGSTLTTVLAHRHLDRAQTLLPQLRIGRTPTFNEGLSPKASATSVDRYSNLAPLLRAVDDLGVNGKLIRNISSYHGTDHCIHERLSRQRRPERVSHQPGNRTGSVRRHPMEAL